MLWKPPQRNWVVLIVLLGSHACSHPPGAAVISPARMPRLATVEDRFQSFNVEMVEVTGGRFWKPYREIEGVLKTEESSKQAAAVPAGMNPELYQYRPPIDLTNKKLRKLAAALAPSYLRVSGTWANSTYFYNADTTAPAKPPAGFNGILTRSQWKGVMQFSEATGAKLITSFATSAGTRDAKGLWTPVEAEKLLSYTASLGGSIAAAEFMNEPTLAVMGGAPKGYDAAAYGRDLAVFRPYLKKTSPSVLLLGPGSVGEGLPLGDALIPSGMSFLKSADLLAAAGPGFDAFSYHFYGAVSARCASLGAGSTTKIDAALTNEWLSRTDQAEAFYQDLRDRFEPGKPIWITETADAACGGNRWASTFVDSFRYLDQLGRMARRGVQVVAHNTLASSDYGLLDENTLDPRPNYWAALLWRSLMGNTVLEAGPSPASGLHLYAHCLRGQPGGVALLVINTNRTATQALEFGTASDRYSLTAKRLDSSSIALNGAELRLESGDLVPTLMATPVVAGPQSFAPASITFLAIPAANNSSCR
ncbi:hypothetical protein [Bryobacter aggregatus]|uniref:hypothetical protein n=1 Tax=Bryobacter aggregatus TaxID=360054 RepID=UPI0004E2052A|nr:hypothetical protein [Bryobacter aggregatus]